MPAASAATVRGNGKLRCSVVGISMQSSLLINTYIHKRSPTVYIYIYIISTRPKSGAAHLNEEEQEDNEGARRPPGGSAELVPAAAAEAKEEDVGGVLLSGLYVATDVKLHVMSGLKIKACITFDWA